MTITKFSNYVLYVLLVVSVIFIGAFFMGGYVAGTEGTTAAEPLVTNSILSWAYVLFFIATAVSLVFPIVYMIMNPKNVVRSLIILAGIIALVFIAYSMASDEVLNIVGYNGPDNVPATLKRTDTAIILTFILMGVAVLSILYTEIAKLFK